MNYVLWTCDNCGFTKRVDRDSGDYYPAGWFGIKHWLTDWDVCGPACAHTVIETTVVAKKAAS